MWTRNMEKGLSDIESWSARSRTSTVGGLKYGGLIMVHCGIQEWVKTNELVVVWHIQVEVKPRLELHASKVKPKANSTELKLLATAVVSLIPKFGLSSRTDLQRDSQVVGRVTFYSGRVEWSFCFQWSSRRGKHPVQCLWEGEYSEDYEMLISCVWAWKDMPSPLNLVAVDQPIYCSWSGFCLIGRLGGPRHPPPYRVGLFEGFGSSRKNFIRFMVYIGFQRRKTRCNKRAKDVMP